MSTLHSPHDQLFKSSMADMRVARDFFEHHYPRELSRHPCEGAVVSGKKQDDRKLEISLLPLRDVVDAWRQKVARSAG